jgi:hypothetical protein
VILPIVFKRPGDKEPEASIYYEVAANGVFQIRDTGTYRAVTRAQEEIPGLLTEKECVELRFPRLPAAVLEEAVAFFREVYRRYGGESIVILFYRPNTEEFRVDAPRQTIPGYRDWRGQWRASLRLDYDEAPRPPGFLRFGTIHSHADMAAYSSFTDCHDEQYHDGLHVVYGHVHTAYPSRSACFVAGGTRFPLQAEDVLEPFVALNRPARPEWVGRVKRGEEKSYASYGSYSGGSWSSWDAGTGGNHGQGNESGAS